MNQERGKGVLVITPILAIEGCNNFGTCERHLSHNFPCGATIATIHMYTLIGNKTRILNK